MPAGPYLRADPPVGRRSPPATLHRIRPGRPHTLMRMTVAVLVAVVALVIAACGTTSSAPTPSAGGFVSVHAAWARPAAKGRDSAAYLTITNGRLGAEVLVGASTPAATAARVHQTTTAD